MPGAPRASAAARGGLGGPRHLGEPPTEPPTVETVLYPAQPRDPKCPRFPPNEDTGDIPNMLVNLLGTFFFPAGGAGTKLIPRGGGMGGRDTHGVPIGRAGWGLARIWPGPDPNWIWQPEPYVKEHNGTIGARGGLRRLGGRDGGGKGGLHPSTSLPFGGTQAARGPRCLGVGWGGMGAVTHPSLSHLGGPRCLGVGSTGGHPSTSLPS